MAALGSCAFTGRKYAAALFRARTHTAVSAGFLLRLPARLPARPPAFPPARLHLLGPRPGRVRPSVRPSVCVRLFLRARLHARACARARCFATSAASESCLSVCLSPRACGPMGSGTGPHVCARGCVRVSAHTHPCHTNTLRVFVYVSGSMSRSESLCVPLASPPSTGVGGRRWAKCVCLWAAWRVYLRASWNSTPLGHVGLGAWVGWVSAGRRGGRCWSGCRTRITPPASSRPLSVVQVQCPHSLLQRAGNK